MAGGIADMQTIAIELTPEQGDEITRFRKTHGAIGGAMLGQPRALNMSGSYTEMKLVILSPATAESVAEALKETGGE
jgi:hypothetical protein